MEILYHNKFLVSLVLGLLIAFVYYKYTEMRNTDKEEINKDRYLYVFAMVAFGIFMALFMTEENLDNVLNEIEVGEPPF